MDEKKKLSEEELKNVAGGIGTSELCYFTPTGKEKTEVGQTWLECASGCGTDRILFAQKCHCHDHAGQYCVNRWHKVDGNNELLPGNASNHSNKKKANNYNT